MSKALRFDVLTRDKFTCQYCGGRPPSVELEVDHIVAVANGGASVMDNLVAACKECNRGKRDRY
jgi:5-methylcytosine-specific restriction endonuclease McrA